MRPMPTLPSMPVVADYVALRRYHDYLVDLHETVRSIRDDARASADRVLTNNGLADDFKVTQIGHGLSVGEAIYRSSSSAWALAQADAQSTLADGIVSKVDDTETFWVTTGGRVVWLAHGLTVGTIYYLDASSAGDQTTSKPASSGQFVQSLLKPLDSDTVLVNVHVIEEIP